MAGRCVRWVGSRAVLTDMDGVLVHEGRLWGCGTPFLVLTNDSIYTPWDLRFRLLRSGIDVRVDAIWASAPATGPFWTTSGRRAARTSWVRPG